MITELALAWGLSHPEWDKVLQHSVNSSKVTEVKTPCKTLKTKECLIQALSIMAKYESGFNNREKYLENFKDHQGNKVISRGLLQLSQESANQKAYGCGIKLPEDLHKYDVNISCAVKIAVYWINKDKVFFGNEKNLGMSRYWSVGRKTSKSHEAILKYLAAL